MAQEIEPKFLASGTGPAHANGKRRVNSRRSTSDERSTNLIAANSANDWRMEIGHVHRDGGLIVGFVGHCNSADTRIPSTGRGGLPGERRKPQRVHPRCIQVVQQTHSRRYPDYDLPPTESPLSHSGMSGRVYEPVSTVSAIARGAARFRSAKFGGKVVSNAAGSRHRRNQHELQSE
jgi:hypothetical protein